MDFQRKCTHIYRFQLLKQNKAKSALILPHFIHNSKRFELFITFKQNANHNETLKSYSRATFIMVMLTWDIQMVDTLGVGNWMEDTQVEDNLQVGSLEVEVDNHRAVHMPEVDIQQREELADQYATSAELGVLPSLVVDQTCHLVCPFQSCVESGK